MIKTYQRIYIHFFWHIPNFCCFFKTIHPYLRYLRWFSNRCLMLGSDRIRTPIYISFWRGSGWNWSTLTTILSLTYLRYLQSFSQRLLWDGINSIISIFQCLNFYTHINWSTVCSQLFWSPIRPHLQKIESTDTHAYRWFFWIKHIQRQGGWWRVRVCLEQQILYSNICLHAVRDNWLIVTNM